MLERLSDAARNGRTPTALEIIDPLIEYGAITRHALPPRADLQRNIEMAILGSATAHQ
jgi:hypothetical protein